MIVLPTAAEAGPVDFQRRQVVLITAGTQEVPGRSVAVEKAVVYTDRVEFTSTLVDPAVLPEGEEEKGSRRPAVFLSTEQSPLPLKLVWDARGK